MPSAERFTRRPQGPDSSEHSAQLDQRLAESLGRLERAVSEIHDSETFRGQLRTNHAESLIVIWDNGPAHGGDAVRAYLTTPDLHLRLVRLPAYSPDFNPDEAIWGWIREEVTANTCFGTKAKVQQHVGQFFHDIAKRPTRSSVGAGASSRLRPMPSHRLSKLSSSSPTMWIPPWLWFRSAPVVLEALAEHPNLIDIHYTRPPYSAPSCNRRSAVSSDPGRGALPRCSWSPRSSRGACPERARPPN